jgi:sarcosine oxidase, subunit beta
LYVAFDAAQLGKLDHYARDACPYGLDVEMLDRAETRRRFPWLSDTVMGASWSARDATANPRLITPAAARAACTLGAEILTGVRVMAITKEAGRFRLATERDQIVVEADHLVNAAGAWGAEIAAHFGETAPIFAAGPPQFVTEPVRHFIGPSVQAVDGRIIFRQIPRGNVIVAGYPRGASDMVRNRAPVDPVKTLVNMRRLIDVVPRLASVAVIRVWSGIEGYLPDMLPVIGPSRTTPGLLHAFGFCGHGFQLGPGVGVVLSELIADGASPTPLEPFLIERFEREVTADEKYLREFDARAGSQS